MADFDERTKAELIASLSQARGQMSRSAGAVAQALNIPRNLRSSFSRNQTGWLAGAALSGWLLSRLPARRKKVRVHVGGKGSHPVGKGMRAGLLLGILKFGASLAKPAITALAKDKIGEMMRRR